MSEKELYNCMRNAITTSLNFLKEKFKSETIHPIFDFVPKIEIDKRFWHLELISILPLASYAKTHTDEILNLPEVISCIEFMLEEDFPKKLEMKIVDKNGKPVEHPDYKPFLGAEFIIEFLMKYVDYKNNFDFDEMLFKTLYSELEEYVYTDGMEIIAVVPLENFEVKDHERINLGEFIIRKLTEDEIKKLIRFGFFTKMGPYGSFITPEWCIEFSKKFKSKIQDESLSYDVQRIISALRLFKQGGLDYLTILRYPKVWKISWSASSQREIIYGQRYDFLDEDMESFKRFWHKFKTIDIKKHSFLNIAIRRFNSFYEQRLLEDKLVDFIIALEALFLLETQELSYKLALGCAYFIGKNKEERKEIFNKIKEAYKVRSKIIHGKTSQVDPELVTLIEDYVRKSINKYFDILQFQNTSHKKIIEELDIKIIIGNNDKNN